MQNLPSAEVYDQEYRYMPWGKLITAVAEYVMNTVPLNGTVLDLMCGTGHLLNLLHARRPDLTYLGVDAEPSYLELAQRNCPWAHFIDADVRAWTTDKKFDAVLCTAGVHHLPYPEQSPFIGKIASCMKGGGFAIIADPYIDDFKDTHERKLAAAKLGYEYLWVTIDNGAPPAVIDAAIEVMRNDIHLVEFKTSVEKREAELVQHFRSVTRRRVWPEVKVFEGPGYGDYYFILRN